MGVNGDQGEDKPSEGEDLKETSFVVGGRASPAGGIGTTPPPPPRRETAAAPFGSDRFNIDRLEELRRRGVPIVLFLGMRTTGKTWLLQRLKSMLRENFDCDPKFQLTDVAQESDTVTLADERRVAEKYGAPTLEALRESKAAASSTRTSAMIIHEFEPVARGKGKHFALVDFPGEMFRSLADGLFGELRSLALAIKYANVLIIALPADISVLAASVDSEVFDAHAHVEMTRADREFLEKLTGSIATICKIRSLLTQNDISVGWKPDGAPADDYDKQITSSALRAHDWENGRIPFGGWDGLECPTFVALTKADKFFSASDTLPDIDRRNRMTRANLLDFNKTLCELPESMLLKDLFEKSLLNTENLLDRHSSSSGLMRKLVGPSGHVAPISNPPEMIKQADPALFNRLAANFPMSRVDLVSAFYGHTGNSLTVRDIGKYPEVGVRNLVEWLASVHDQGLNASHRWARAVFDHIYDTNSLVPSPTGGTKIAKTPKRLAIFSPRMLSKMFRKEWHFGQAMPAAIAAILVLAMAFATFNPFEKGTVVTDTLTYQALEVEVSSFEQALAAGMVADEKVLTPALQDLSTVYDPKRSRLYAGLPGQTAIRGAEDSSQPLTIAGGLANWKAVAGEYEIPAFFELSLPQTNDKERAWFDTYVCRLYGWSEGYRDIVRKAAIRGYGNCGPFQKWLMRSSLVERARVAAGQNGVWLGIMLLLLGWLLALLAVLNAAWFRKTRKAYAWLYHSGVATVQRPGTRDAG
jgi:hypothetical protein